MDRDQLLAMSKDELVVLLELAIKGQIASNQNMMQMSALLSTTDEKMHKLEDEKATLEAELALLRNQP